MNSTKIYNELINASRDIYRKVKPSKQTIYSKDTRKLRKTYKTAVETYKQLQTEENLNTLLQNKRQYNKTLKSEKRNLQRVELRELQNAKIDNDTKKYWELINKNKPNKSKKPLQILLHITLKIASKTTINS